MKAWLGSCGRLNFFHDLIVQYQNICGGKLNKVKHCGGEEEGNIIDMNGQMHIHGYMFMLL